MSETKRAPDPDGLVIRGVDGAGYEWAIVVRDGHEYARSWSPRLQEWVLVDPSDERIILRCAFHAMRERADSLDAALKRRTAQTFKALDNGDAFADAAESWKARAEKAEAIAAAWARVWEANRACNATTRGADAERFRATRQEYTDASDALRDLGVKL